MTRQELTNQIFLKETFLCIGLDTEISKIPIHLLDYEDPIFEFNKAIINATHDLAVAYKPNTAFYECEGLKGWVSLYKTLEYIRLNHPDLYIIADAKRGDIGNTSGKYAEAFLVDHEPYGSFDAVTIAPYMGEDSVKPFLGFDGKWAILLALTSNKGAGDFQKLEIKDDSLPLFMEVIKKSKCWGTENNMMYVVGATQAKMLAEIRKLVPEHFLLIPGVGAQGGNIEEVIRFGAINKGGILINASRSIIYASTGIDFAEKARVEALKLRSEMGFWFKNQ